MSDDTNRSKMELETLFDNLFDSVEQASAEDLLAEAKSLGHDTEQIALDVTDILLAAVRSFEQRKLDAARAAYRTRSKGIGRRRFILPSTPTERRRLLFDASVKNQRVAQVTAMFRDLNELSDEDVESALEDLIELGAFDDTAEKSDDGTK